MFRKTDEHAVSPVVGVILMVAITVLLAIVVTAFGFGFGSPDAKGPVASIQVGNSPETTEIDLKIVHKSGETFRAGDWKISIVEVGSPPKYIPGSSDFSVGDQIITTNLTNSPGTVIATDREINVIGPRTPIRSGVKYDVKIIVFPYKTMTVDAVVIAR